jgi:hypothetical protein
MGRVLFRRNPERVAPAFAISGEATLSGLRLQFMGRVFPRVAKAQPGARIGEHLRCLGLQAILVTKTQSGTNSSGVTTRCGSVRDECENVSRLLAINIAS